MARGFFQNCERWAGKHCHKLISVADAMTELMVEANVAPRAEVVTIYSGMEVEPFAHADELRECSRVQYGFAPDHVVIGKIARLFHLKGHDDLVTIGRHHQPVPRCSVPTGRRRHFAGSMTSKSNRILGLSDHFVFAGLVARTEVPTIISAMDVLVHTSLREGLARVLPQALIAGRPAVSYDIDGAREVVITGQTGVLVTPRVPLGIGRINYFARCRCAIAS